MSDETEKQVPSLAVMECSNCLTENPSRFRHCGACGHRLGATVCSMCNFTTPLPFTFCGDCGTALDLTAGSSLEERKLATVLFADVVGFTSLADGSDPEDMARIMDTAFRQLSDIVIAHGGVVDKYIGDSLMAVFGAPVSHDDDAERAVAAALAIVAAETGLGFSIGVNTGEVMITALAGGAVTVMGDAVNVAARLEKAAKNGEVLVGPVTYELTAARIAYRDRPPMTLKGKREPVEVRQAMTLRTTPIPALLADSPLVGRVEDLEFLLAQWRRVSATSRSALVLLTGDPGIGKSRLLDELAARVDGESLVVRSTYPPYGGYGGVRVGGDLVTQLGPSDDPAVQKKVRTLLGEMDASMTGMDAATLRSEQLWALRRLAEDRTEKQSVVVLIEDAHMASTSIDLLTSFVARISDLSILVVLAGRPEGKWLTSFATANTLRLGPLSLEDSRKLAWHWGRQSGLPVGERPAGGTRSAAEMGPASLERGADVDSEDRLLRWTGGNPLFLREVLAFNRQHPDLTDQRRLPMSLRSVLAARLDALAPAERSALQDFAVIGDTATVEQLVALGGAPASEGVAGLTNAGLVRHRPDGTLRITEPLLREVAYSTLAKATRVERHLRMAELSHRSDDRARHLARAQAMAPDDVALKVRAAEALASAGIEAFEVSRRTEGITMLRQALDLGFRKPAALLRLADALNDGDHHGAIDVLAMIPEPSGDARVDAERVLVRANALVDIDTEAAWRGFDDAAAQWHELGDHIKEGWSHSNKGVALFFHGNVVEADAELVRALTFFAQESYRIGELATLSFRALVRPEHPDAELWLHESLAYAIELGDRSRHLSVLGALQWHHFLRSRLGGAVETLAAHNWIDETITLASELGWTNFLVQGHCLRANLARMEGNFALAESEVAAAREFEPIESPGERALLEAISASLVPGTAFRRFDDTDPLTSVAAVIQLESALLEGRFDEIIEQGLMPSRNNLGPRQIGVGFLPAAAGLLVAGQLESASLTAKHLLSDAPGVNPLALLGARALLAEYALRLDAPSAESEIAALPGLGDRPGGLVGSLILRAQALSGNEEARDELRDFALFVRAPGLLAGIDALAL